MSRAKTSLAALPEKDREMFNKLTKRTRRAEQLLMFNKLGALSLKHRAAKLLSNTCFVFLTALDDVPNCMRVLAVCGSHCVGRI